MKDPAFLFYSSDFLTGTMLMDNEQIGKYIRLMCLQHQKGHLSEKEMLKVCEVYDEAIFSKFSKDDEGLYYNKRLEEEVNRRKNYSESRRKNRQKKTEDMKNICLTYEEHMETENENENIKKKKDNKSNKDLKTDLPEFVTMTNDEYNKLLATHSKEFVDKCLERLSNYKGSTGKKYKSDYRAILSWVVDDVKKKMYSNQFNKDKPTMAYTNPEQTEFNDLERFYSNM